MAHRDRIKDLRRVRAGDLKPNPRNWRTHPEGQRSALQAVLADVGWADALIAREKDGGLELIDGHLRADLDPEAEVPVLVVDLNDDEAAKVLLTLDPISALATSDISAMASLIKAVGPMDGILGSLAKRLDAGALRPMMLTGEPLDLSAERDIPPSKIIKRVSVGDLWRIAGHVVACGDSTSPETMPRALSGASADLIVTSPPYNVGKDYDEHDDDMPPADYDEMIASVIKNSAASLGGGRFICWNVAVARGTRHWMHQVAMDAAGLEYRRQIVWTKSGTTMPAWNHFTANPLARAYRPNNQHEVIFLHSKGPPEHGALVVPDNRFSSDVWHFPASQATRDIPTVSYGRGDSLSSARHPVKAHPAVMLHHIAAGLIAHLSAKGEVVLDPFAGAGTTIIAAHRIGRVGVGVELSPAYCDIALARIEAATGAVAALA